MTKSRFFTSVLAAILFLPFIGNGNPRHIEQNDPRTYITTSLGYFYHMSVEPRAAWFIKSSESAPVSLRFQVFFTKDDSCGEGTQIAAGFIEPGQTINGNHEVSSGHYTVRINDLKHSTLTFSVVDMQ